MRAPPQANPRSRGSRLWSLIAPDAWTIFAGVLSGFLAGGTQLILPQAVGIVLDASLVPFGFAVAVVGVLCLGGLGRFGEKMFFSTAAQRSVARLRKAVFDSILQQEIDFFDSERAGDLTSRLMTDTQALELVLIDEVGSATRALVLVLGGSLILIWMSPALTLTAFIVLAPLVVFVDFMGRRAGELMRDYQSNTGSMASIAAEAISGIRALRANDQESFASRRFAAAAEGSLATGRKHNFIYGLVRGVSAVGPELGAIVVILFAAPLFSAGRISTGDIAAFVFTGLLALNAVRDLGGCATELRRASGSLQRVMEILIREPRIPAGEGLSPDPMKGEVVFEDVGFIYPSRPETGVLRGVNLTIHPGEVLAIVGASGAGKSTLSGLMLRFHDPTSGRLLIDGADTRTLNGRWLRRRIGLVAQEPTLFAMTIAENIQLGLTEISPSDLIAAARTANAYEFIMALPGGFDCQVGDRGVQLSGGQRQRIALARTVVKNPCILVLDEATSALDSESESLVHEALDRLMVGRTTLIIAHRLSTIRSARRVIVLDGGQVAGSGTHDSLMVTSPIYADLVEKQIFSA